MDQQTPPVQTSTSSKVDFLLKKFDGVNLTLLNVVQTLHQLMEEVEKIESKGSDKKSLVIECLKILVSNVKDDNTRTKLNDFIDHIVSPTIDTIVMATKGIIAINKDLGCCASCSIQ